MEFVSIKGIRVMPKTHQQEVTSLSYSPDGRKIVSTSRDCTVKLWDRRRLKCIATYKHEDNDYPRCVAFSPDGKYIVTGSQNSFIRLLTADTLELK